MAGLVCLSKAAYGQDLVVSVRGELYDVLADGVVGIVGQQAVSQAQPCILVCGRCAVSRDELTATGVTSAYGLQEAHTVEPQEATDPHELEARLVDLDSRLARTWLRRSEHWRQHTAAGQPGLSRWGSRWSSRAR